MKDLRILLKTSGLFLLKAFGNYVWLKIIYLIILLFDVQVLGGPAPEYNAINVICMGLGIFMAMNTVYLVEDKKVRVWSKEFGLGNNLKKEDNG